MDADFSIELGRDDPVLDFPWKDPAGRLAYFDLKRQPELIAQVEEAQQFPELGEFLRAVNSPRSLMESAKCDAWATTELSLEEDVFDASHKFASYVDLVFSNTASANALVANADVADADAATIDRRLSFPVHEDFAKRLAELLRRAPEISSSVEVCIRRCFFGDAGETREGFYFTAYITGYGSDEAAARRNWEVAVKLAANAIGQLALSGRCE
jgi:hypothetical protein